MANGVESAISKPVSLRSSRFLRNPALGDSELAVRAGFGRRVKIRDLARELRKFSKVVVLGDPGSGKSVCLRKLAYDLAQGELESNGRHAVSPSLWIWVLTMVGKMRRADCRR